MLYVIQGAEVYNPDKIGVKDVVFCQGKVISIDDKFEWLQTNRVEVIDAENNYLIPGFIDQHVHFLGGGGSGGFASRAPELMFSHFSAAGITTAVSCIGIDTLSKDMKALLAKSAALEKEGLTTYCLTGGYQIPLITFTEDISNDIVYLDKILGVGELAIADNRGSQPQISELVRIAAQTHVAGFLAGKPAPMVLHLGDRPNLSKVLWEFLEDADLPYGQYTLTHVNRNASCFKEAVRFGLEGGNIDITSNVSEEKGNKGAINPGRAIKEFLNEGVPLSNITMSSDAGGARPTFDKQGRATRVMWLKPMSLYEEFKSSILNEGIEFSDALKTITANPAKVLGIHNSKGYIREGFDADFVLLEKDTLKIKEVYIKGKRVVEEGKPVCKGLYEDLM